MKLVRVSQGRTDVVFTELDPGTAVDRFVDFLLFVTSQAQVTRLTNNVVRVSMNGNSTTYRLESV